MREKLFPFSLLGKALQWFHSQPVETVQDWNAVGVLDWQTYQGDTEVVDCAVRIVIGRPRTRRFAQGHGTQDLYRFGLPRWRTLRPVWGIKYGALRLVLG
jgi:hypothetical protein